MPPPTLSLHATSPGDIATAAAILRDGGTVAFPTETVYGLGANALLPSSVEKIFLAKARPSWDPLIVHIQTVADLAGIVTGISSLAQRLVDAFWPGPLTLLLPRTPAIPDAVTAGRALVGVRSPAHPVARALLEAAGLPIAAPSANRFGHTSPTTAAHVFADLEGRIDAVLDGGSSEVGLESTVAEVRKGEIVLYRPGAITEEMIRAVAGGGIEVHSYRPSPQVRDRTPESLPSPGVGIRHYAPRAQLSLVEVPRTHPEQCLISATAEALGRGKTGVMLPTGWGSTPGTQVFAWGSWTDERELAQRLFDGLRTLDHVHVRTIVCPLPKGEGLRAAMEDRLEKAAR